MPPTVVELGGLPVNIPNGSQILKLSLSAPRLNYFQAQMQNMKAQAIKCILCASSSNPQSALRIVAQNQTNTSAIDNWSTIHYSPAAVTQQSDNHRPLPKQCEVEAQAKRHG